MSKYNKMPATMAGCILDHSQGGPNLSRDILWYAEHNGFLLDDDDKIVCEQDQDDLDDYTRDALRELSEDAVDWLTAHIAAEGMIFEVEDNSLWYTATDDYHMRDGTSAARVLP